MRIDPVTGVCDAGRSSPRVVAFVVFTWPFTRLVVRLWHWEWGAEIARLLLVVSFFVPSSCARLVMTVTEYASVVRQSPFSRVVSSPSSHRDIAAAVPALLR